ncbi:tetratricopeptide repeat protein [Aerosakkonema funiforme]|uniref:tetratricopeptide repeat protein n=1 Tax=Aerosakkonema funiforme TaxID=1246630 RepID=UPI0035B6F5D1
MNYSQEILAKLNEEIARNPKNAKSLAYRGETYRQMKCYQEALADFSRAIALKPNYAWALAHRGETYHLLKRYSEALADFNKAIEISPTYFWAIAHRAGSYHKLDRHFEALLDLDRAIELKPDYAWAIAYRSGFYTLMRRYEEALVNFDKALSLDETVIDHWHSERGLILTCLGRYAEAVECCEQGLKKNPDDYTILYTLAVAKASWIGLADAQPQIDKARVLLQGVVNSEVRAGVLYRLGGLAALEGQSDRAFNYLVEAISLENEPLELARHDLAWLELRQDPRFESLTAETLKN